jgi:formylmethanofuran dehydrogenase subunit E
MVINYISILPCVAFAGVMSLSVSCNSALTVPAGASPAAALLNQLATFYGHVCAGSIFGARLGFAASEVLKNKGATGGFRARYYDLTCPVDDPHLVAITSCGCNSMAVPNRGEHRLVLTSDVAKCAVEARLTRKAEEMGIRSRNLVERIHDLPPGAAERLVLEEKVEEIYTWLGTAPADEVVLITLLEENTINEHGGVNEH